MSQKPIVTSAIVVLLIIATASIAVVGQALRPPLPPENHSAAKVLALSEDPAEQLRARSYYLERCDNGDGWACGKAGWLQKQSETGLDYLVHYADGCELGNAWSCAQYAHNMRPELEHGDGDVMVDALRKGCRGDNSWSCMMLGREYSEGTFVPKDELLASYLYRTSCAEGEAYGCLYLGSMYDEAGQIEHGEEFFLEACEKGLPFGCMIAGARMREKDPARSLELLQRACGEGVESACEMMGER